MGVDGLRALISDADGVGVVPSVIIDSVLADGMVVDMSGTQFKGPRADIDKPMP